MNTSAVIVQREMLWVFCPPGQYEVHCPGVVVKDKSVGHSLCISSQRMPFHRLHSQGT